MKLRDLASQPFVLRSRVEAPEAELAALHHDSRRAGPETAFFAMAGAASDGHAFLDAALAAGAPALFLSDTARFDRLAAGPMPRCGGVFLVRPGRESLADAARLVYGHPSRELRLLGVTGTNGKATVTFLASQMLAALGTPCAILGSLGMRLDGQAVQDTGRTTPEAPDLQGFLRECVRRGVGAAAMEVSSIGIHQGRTHGLSFAAAAFTNLTQDHLDYHGDMAAYGAEKARLFLDYGPPCAVLNRDDAFGRALEQRLARERSGVRVLTYSLAGEGALTAARLERTPAATRGVLRAEGGEHAFALPLPGDFNLANWLAAVGLLLALGRRPAEAAASAARCRGAPGRFERVPVPRPFTVVVDYAHTPDALETVLRTARGLAQGRVGVLFGCGGGRDRAKRPLMGAIAARLADLAVLTSDNPRGEDPEAILTEVERGMSGGPPHWRIADRGAAIRALLEWARPGDFLLIAGKGSETTQEIAGRKLPWDDRDAVRQWAGSLA
jgi:UDP-N-acetylmuramoyl-L-alanyl-D-glutamate--2,6-diaminopimelate ligase